MPGVEPLPVEDLPEELGETVAAYLAGSGKVPNSFRTMARKPKIAAAYGALQKAIGASLTISPILRSMMFLLQSQNNGCRYCQAHSVSALVRGAVPEAKIDALWEFETSPLFDEAERAALRFALAVSAHPNAVEPEHFEALRAHFSEDQIVEMVAALSIGAFLNTWNDTMGTELEAASTEIANARLGDRGWTPGKHEKA